MQSSSRGACMVATPRARLVGIALIGCTVLARRRVDRAGGAPYCMVDSLTPAEVAFFKREGYLILHSVLDAEHLRQARALWWRYARQDQQQRLRLQETDPSTWLGGLDGDNKKMYWECQSVGGSEEFLDLLPRAVWGAAEQLCGRGSLVWPSGQLTGTGTKPGHNYAHPGANFLGQGSPGQACRGVYSLLPLRLTDMERAECRAQQQANPQQLGAHVDGWDGDDWLLSVNTTLDDVPRFGGAFCVWPRSHHRTYPLQKHHYDWERVWSEGGLTEGVGRTYCPEFIAELERIKKNTRPVECFAPTGSVTFWHHRLVHSASPNTGVGIRSGVIYDFYKKGPPWSREQMRADVETGNPQDMWVDWSDEVRRCTISSDSVPAKL